MEKSGDNKICFCFLGGREREERQDKRQTDRQSQQDIERNVIDNENTGTHLCHSKVYQKAPAVISATEQNTRRVCYTVCFLKNHVFMCVITSVNTLWGIELLVYISKCVPLYSNCHFLNTNLGLYFKLPPATLKKILYIFQEFCTKLYI